MSSPPSRLLVLGTSDITTPEGQERDAVLAHPKRLALLTYLLLARPSGYHRRDSLFALLWPEADEERARSSLRQAVHHIRRALGHQALVSRGDEELAVDGSQVSCDALAMERLLDEGRTAEALELYRGDLLPGFFAGDAAGFEDWLERERSRLRSRAAEAGWALVQAQESAGDRTGAVARARWSAGLEPHDELAQRRLIEVLDRLEGPAAALAAYQEYRSRLKRDFDAAPSDETEAMAAAVRARAAAASHRYRGVAALLQPPFVRRHAPALLFAAGALTVLAIAGARSRLVARGSGLDPTAVLVAPFRLATADTSLSFLREGLVDLVSAKLGGTPGIRAVDARAVLAAWRQLAAPGEVPATEARRLAARLKAGRVLLGAIVGRPQRLLLTASVHEVRSGRAGEVISIEGPLDSLPELVDRLVATVLTTEAGEPSTRLRELTAASLPALRSYLKGRSAYRRGRYAEAVERFREAYEQDTTSAVIALELASAADWLADGQEEDARERAWRLRARLSLRDRAHLEALLGSAYPAWTGVAAWIAGWERAARLMSDRPEVWFELGDRLFHQGDVTGLDSGGARAAEAFSRAVELDSSYAAPLLHLTQLAIRRGDLAEARRLGSLYLARDSAGDDADFLRWRLAVALGDSAGATRVERRFGSLTSRSLLLIASWSQFEGVRVAAGLRAAQELARRESRPEAASLGPRILAQTYANLGRFEDRERLFAPWGVSPEHLEALRINDALWSDGAAARAGAAILNRERRAAAGDRLSALNVALWREVLYPESAYVLPPGAETAGTPVAREALHALRAARTGSLDSRSRLATLDSFRLAQYSASSALTWLAMIRALVLERMGENAEALAAVRARPLIDESGLAHLAGALRLEGRLALAAGDTACARRAWRHYLALRYDPDPGLRLARDSVAAALQRLEPTRRGS
jgi:serine/threonine-protein kinase